MAVPVLECPELASGKRDRHYMELFWGDIHNHNAVGVGQGSLERSYSIAANTLDFYAFTPHGWWTDIARADPSVEEYHLAGFAKTKDNWQRIVQTANAWNKAGRLATLVAYEWHSSAWGDYCVYFPQDRGTLFYARDMDELKTFALEKGALLIPHHCAYKRGWRGTDWRSLDADLSPVAEIFSEHGNSLEPESHLGMYRHSMGGSDHTQSVLVQIRSGRVLGFTAGTDDHFGHPGCYGEGLMGLYAAELSREAVLDAIRKRHTYAVTGDRIELDFGIGAGMMGDMLPCSVPRELRIRVRGLGALDYVEVLKNGRGAAKWQTGPVSPGSGLPDLVRLEWGWGGMKSLDKTCWNIEARVEGGRLERVFPCFCGGPDVVEDENRLQRPERNRVDIRSYTCRTNFGPTQAVVIALSGDAGTKLRVSMQGQWGSRKFSQVVSLSKRDMGAASHSYKVAPVFSAPQLKIHPLCSGTESCFEKEWVDPRPASSDSYFVKVVQKNGQMAWSSPIWFVGD